MKQEYFQGRSKPELEKDSALKSEFLHNLHLSIQAFVTLFTCQDDSSMQEIQKMVQTAWETNVFSGMVRVLFYEETGTIHGCEPLAHCNVVRDDIRHSHWSMQSLCASRAPHSELIPYWDVTQGDISLLEKQRATLPLVPPAMQMKGVLQNTENCQHTTPPCSSHTLGSGKQSLEAPSPYSPQVWESTLWRIKSTPLARGARSTT